MIIGTIHPDQLNCFRALLSDTAIQRTESPGTLIIGAASETQSGPEATGVLAAQLFPGGAQIFWLYVSPAWRNLGIGTALLKTLLESMQKSGWSGTVFSVIEPDAPDALRTFLRKNLFSGKSVVEKGIPCLLVNDLQHSRFDNPPPQGTVLLKDLPKVYRQQAATQLEYRNAAIDLPPRWDTFAPCSTAFLKDGQIQAVVLFLEEDYRLSLAAIGVRPKCSRAVTVSLIAAVQQIRKQYPPETKLNLATLNDASEQIASLFPGKITREMYEVFTFPLT